MDLSSTADDIRDAAVGQCGGQSNQYLWIDAPASAFGLYSSEFATGEPDQREGPGETYCAMIQTKPPYK